MSVDHLPSFPTSGQISSNPFYQTNLDDQTAQIQQALDKADTTVKPAAQPFMAATGKQFLSDYVSYMKDPNAQTNDKAYKDLLAYNADVTGNATNSHDALSALQNLFKQSVGNMASGDPLTDPGSSITDPTGFNSNNSTTDAELWNPNDG